VQQLLAGAVARGVAGSATAASTAAALVGARNKEGATALYLAAREVVDGATAIAVMSVLVSAGADVSARCSNGRTAVLAAAGAGRRLALRWLIETAGADVTACDGAGFNVLHALAEAHDVGEGDGGAAAGAGDGRTADVGPARSSADSPAPASEASSPPPPPPPPPPPSVASCIAYVFWDGGVGGADDSAARWRCHIPGMLSESRDACGRTPLHIAAARGNATFVAEAIGWVERSDTDADAGAGAHATARLVNAVDSRDCTALYYAVAGGHPAASRLLLSSGADPTARSPQRSIVHVAAMWDRAQLIDILCEAVWARGGGGARAVATAVAEHDGEGRTAMEVARLHGREGAAARLDDWCRRCG